MRHPSSDNRAAQFMFASPRRAKHVRTSSCAKALARMSYTRGLASFFIVATPAPNCTWASIHMECHSRSPGKGGEDRQPTGRLSRTHFNRDDLSRVPAQAFRWPSRLFHWRSSSSRGRDGETPSRDGTTHLVMSPLEFM